MDQLKKKKPFDNHLNVNQLKTKPKLLSRLNQLN